MTSVRRIAAASSLLAAVALAFGCQSVVGIEDKTLDTCDERCTACEDYCDLAMTNCTGDHAVYRQRANCLGLCNVLPLGDFDEPADENSVACRTEQALRAGESEPELYCSSAGPGGGTLCGGDCKSFCYLYATVCDSPFETEEACIDKCRALKDEPTFDVEGYYDTDTVECRIIHFANASLPGGLEHCGHGYFQSSLHCGPPAEDPDGNQVLPSCPDFCRVAMVACEGENAVYDDDATCLATCQALPQGENTDINQNTVGCRHYHSYNAILGPVTHCSHAGPSGGGHCGEIEDGAGNCESYCILAEKGCGTAYLAEFPGGVEECHETCAGTPGAADDSDTPDLNETEQYSVTLAESGDPAFSHQCRVLYATRAVAQGGEPSAHCSAAFGAAGSACDFQE